MGRYHSGVCPGAMKVGIARAGQVTPPWLSFFLPLALGMLVFSLPFPWGPCVHVVLSSVTHPTPSPPSLLFSLLVRMKRAQFGPHDWLSLSVPPGPSWLLVDSLEPETAYQFSVLAQNRLGTSAFSEVVTVNTLGEVRGWCVSGLCLSRSGLDKGDASDSLRTNIRNLVCASTLSSLDVPVRIHHFPL